MSGIDPMDDIYGYTLTAVALATLVFALVTREYLMAAIAFSVVGVAARQERLVDGRDAASSGD